MPASDEEKTKERTTSDSTNVPATGAVSKNIYWGCPTVCVPGEIGGAKAPKDFASNVVVTSKYTPWNFVFLFLFEQFQRIANIYFLFVSLVELNFFYLPVENAPFNTSLTKGTSNTLYALIAVIVLEGITVLAEDMKRHRSDAEANNATAHQFDPVSSTFQDVPWKNLKVGDIIQVMSGEKFPADLLLLCAATAKGGGCGQAFVETKSLDGETNLKLRTSKEEITYLFKKEGTAMGDEGTKWNPSEDTLAKLVLDGKCKTITDDPRDAKTSVSIHTFGGQIQLSNAVAALMELGPNKTTLPMNEKNVLLRECVLRNTAYCYAVVLNTGADTKVMKSSTESGIKVSDLDKEINHVISVFLMIMLVLCCIGAGIITGGYDLTNTWLESFYTPDTSDTPAGLFFQSCALFFVGLAQMIPIALLVQLRMARIVQGILMGYDNQMVHVIEANVSLSGEREEIRAAVRTVNLVDELGQLSFIFSDKTGTLTQNIMEYRKMSIDGIAYGQGTTMIGIAAKEREGKKEEAKALLARLKVEESRKHVPFCNFIDGDNEGDVINGNASCYDAIEGKHKTSAVHKQKVEDFFRCLALCHSVEVEHRKTGVYYSASSPDEQALVAGAKHFGFLYEDQVTRDGKAGRGAYRVLRRAKAGVFDDMPEDQTKDCPAEYFRILDVLEFTSARKRMSVIVKDGASGKIRVITKGADSKVFDNLTPAEKNGKLHRRTKAHAAGFANDGLRTLGLGQRFVKQATYDVWKKQIDALRLDPVQTKLKKQQLPNQIDDKAGEMEVGLSLLGATAIEDKLQVGVPDAIAVRRRRRPCTGHSSETLSTVC
jgi:phospholipid-transporting ATPase